jgi:hypothetical protein
MALTLIIERSRDYEFKTSTRNKEYAKNSLKTFGLFCAALRYVLTKIDEISKTSCKGVNKRN